MIAKIVKGSNFKGIVNYILDKEKDAKILVCDGLFAENKETIVSSFEAQARMNPTVINSTSSPTRCFLFWPAWASYAAFQFGSTLSYGNPSASMRTMR